MNLSITICKSNFTGFLRAEEEEGPAAGGEERAVPEGDESAAVAVGAQGGALQGGPVPQVHGGQAHPQRQGQRAKGPAGIQGKLRVNTVTSNFMTWIRLLARCGWGYCQENNV